ncbi:MAG: CvpA family protein [Candidatus Omnitrophica bacterium]|nr:CvpA family protein [Candidatus Omnitrophota bacterium]
MGIFKDFGFIDIIFLILWLGITYAAVSKGIFTEILKILALFINSIFTFQLYPFLAEKVSSKIPFLSKDFNKAVTAITLFVIIWIILGLLIKIIDALFKRKEILFAEKIAAIVFGFFRLAYLASVIVFFLHLFPAKPGTSLGITPRIFKGIAPKVYLATAGSLGKIIPGFTVNTEVEKILNTDSEKQESKEKGA